MFAEVQQKREQLTKLELKIEEMEPQLRQRKDRGFQWLQKNLMELLEEQKVELDNLRAKGVELEVVTGTAAAAAAATVCSVCLPAPLSLVPCPALLCRLLLLWVWV